MKGHRAPVALVRLCAKRFIAALAVPCLACVACLIGCGARLASTSPEPPSDDAADDGGSGFGGSLAAVEAGDDATVAPQAGAADTGSLLPSDDGAAADDAPGAAAAPVGPPFDAGPGGPCTSPPGPGDLAIDELLIESVAGAGDHGEWLEVKSNLSCALDLRGLHGECARAGKAITFDVGSDVWIAAGGTFVVADSVSPAINHDLPGTVIAWRDNPGDVLRNKGTTVTLKAADVIVDSVTYPALPLAVGVSLAFPDDCDPSTRSDFTRWQPSTASWFPGFAGTPNAPNSDVTCPP
jgi:hypothetical protein